MNFFFFSDDGDFLDDDLLDLDLDFFSGSVDDFFFFFFFSFSGSIVIVVDFFQYLVL